MGESGHCIYVVEIILRHKTFRLIPLFICSKLAWAYFSCYFVTKSFASLFCFLTCSPMLLEKSLITVDRLLTQFMMSMDFCVTQFFY
jgi:hypothetical protein